ncbi:unnamed protein product, partial [Mesorhabditis belari]|uniref:Mitochondrial ribosomal protein L18 n=1 Tax=Mesorhabditis belari TaxID=2138241 RepID=A0AAF3FEB3_9BILA
MNRRGVQFVKKFINRNPLNHQLCGLQPAPKGFEFETNAEKKNFLYKAELTQRGTHQEATITHFKDGIVLRASTKDRSIANQLYSTSDTAAALNLGQVLAMKALQSGILRVASGKTKKGENSKHQEAFYDALEKSGLVLGEIKVPEIDYALNRKMTWERHALHPNRYDKIDDDDAAKEKKNLSF